METEAAETWGEPSTKTVSWWWAPESMRPHLAGLSGLDYVQGMIDGHFPPPPFASILGLRLSHVSPGEAVFHCTPDESQFNPIGLVHGGVLCTLLDSAMGVAVQTQLDAGVAYASIEMKVSFLRPLPADGSEIEVRGRALKIGRKVAFAEGHAYDSQGRLLGHGTQSMSRVI